MRDFCRVCALIQIPPFSLIKTLRLAVNANNIAIGIMSTSPRFRLPDFYHGEHGLNAGNAQGFKEHREESHGVFNFKDVIKVGAGDDDVALRASGPDYWDQVPSLEEGKVHVDKDHGEVIALDKHEGGFGSGGDKYLAFKFLEVYSNQFDVGGVIFDDEDLAFGGFSEHEFFRQPREGLQYWDKGHRGKVPDNWQLSYGVWNP